MKFTIRIEKLFAAIVMGLLLAGYIHHDYVKWHDLGLDVFLSRQEHRFDLYMAQPSWFVPLLGSLLIAPVVFGIYEIVGVFFGRLFAKNNV